jgi:hypothetical protein
MQGSALIVIPGVDLGTVFYQVFHDAGVASATRNVQRGASIFILFVHEIRVIPERGSDGVEISLTDHFVNLRAKDRTRKSQSQCER